MIQRFCHYLAPIIFLLVSSCGTPSISNIKENSRNTPGRPVTVSGTVITTPLLPMSTITASELFDESDTILVLSFHGKHHAQGTKASVTGIIIFLDDTNTPANSTILSNSVTAALMRDRRTTPEKAANTTKTLINTLNKVYGSSPLSAVLIEE